MQTSSVSILHITSARLAKNSTYNVLCLYHYNISYMYMYMYNISSMHFVHCSRD